MESPIEFQIFVAYPPGREGRVVELSVPRCGGVDIPAEIYREDGQTMITLFSRSDGPAWRYPLSDFLAAVEAATNAIEAPGSGA